MTALLAVKAEPIAMTGKAQWGLAIEPNGSIVGIYSQAEGIPIQQAGFEPSKVNFENAESYSAWVFGLPNASLPGTRRIPSTAEAAQQN